MIKRGTIVKSTLFSLFMGAVFLGAGVILALGNRVHDIQIAEQSDPLWIASQLQFELLRLESDLGQFVLGSKSASDIDVRFQIAWSRIDIMQTGKLAEIIHGFNIDNSVLGELEATFEKLDLEIGKLPDLMTREDERHQQVQRILFELSAYDPKLRQFTLALAQSKSQLMADFRFGILSLSHEIAYLGIIILSLSGFFTILLLVDLRASKKAERRMTELAEEANIASKAKAVFMSVVSHELRTPLTSILGGIALLKFSHSEKFSAQTTNLLDVIHRNSDRLLSLVNDILDAQSLSEGKVSITKTLVDLNELVATTVENCQTYANQLGVSYAIDASENEVLVSADHGRISQVLSNLISNAAKFTASGDVVEIRVYTTGAWARVDVVDHGKGVAPEEVANLFSRFHQANPGTTGSNKSSGLGLSISKQLIELHNGKIGFESSEGVGSTFWFELALIEDVTPLKSRSTHLPEHV